MTNYKCKNFKHKGLELKIDCRLIIDYKDYNNYNINI